MSSQHSPEVSPPQEPLFELPTFSVSGDPERLGRGQGEHFGGLIRRFIPMRLEAARDYMKEAGGGSVDALLDAGRRSLAVFERWDPKAYAEHSAIARAAKVDAAALFTAGNMTDMRDIVLLSGARPATELPADAEGCSVVLLPPGSTRDGQAIVGQSWDLNPQDIDYVVAIGRDPTDGPSTWSVTVAGCPSLVGMNDRGICVGTTNVKTWGAKVGVGYMNILHGALNQTNLDAAATVLKQAPRSGAHTYWMADERRVMEWEASPDSLRLRQGDSGPIARTNHCLAPEHIAREWEAPSSSSRRRLLRIQRWFKEGPHDLDAVRALYANREDGVDSINRYPEDDQGAATNAVILARPADRELVACRGSANRGHWIRLPFTVKEG